MIEENDFNDDNEFEEGSEELGNESEESKSLEKSEDLEGESEEGSEELEGKSEEGSEELEGESEEEDEGLPFAKAEVVRLMKQNLDSDKMIRERVKVEMNKFLGEILERVCEQLNEYPYTTIEYEMLKESIYPYTNIKRINEEKMRILKHLEAITADCAALSMDVKKTLKLKDVDEEEEKFF
jgi:hypothetical protein